jgi:acyl carrier protein phosphodiesterase
MNWLAHLYLTPADTDGYLGALLGDVVRGPIPQDLAPGVRTAIALHRRIDALTATHPIYRRSAARIDPAHGHYRRVLVDVFYDHVLARDWETLAPEPLAVFLARVYAALDPVAAASPALAPAFYAPLRTQNWLASYATTDGIAVALRRMRARLRRDHPLEHAVADLIAHEPLFTADFHAFFADARALARR